MEGISFISGEELNILTRNVSPCPRIRVRDNYELLKQTRFLAHALQTQQLDKVDFCQLEHVC